MRFEVQWDETETVTTRYYDEVEIPDDELEGLEDDERAELILERVRETTNYSSSKAVYSETESSELVDVLELPMP